MARRSILRSLARRFGYDLRRRDDLVQQSDPFVAQATLLDAPRVATVFDVGAHTGRTVARYREHFPAAAIHAFEPVPDTRTKLEAATGSDRDVTVVPCALGATSGQTRIYVNPAEDTSSLRTFSEDAAQWMPQDVAHTGAPVDIEVDTLDAYCTAHDVTHVDVLKMDVQGGELDVLRGAQAMLARGAIDLIFSEVEFVPVYADQPLAHEVTAFLLARGYRLFRYYELVYAPQGRLLWGDALYLSPARMAALPAGDRVYRQCKTMD